LAEEFLQNKTIQNINERRTNTRNAAKTSISSLESRSQSQNKGDIKV